MPSVRAHARVIASEMHAGFGALRSECPMNIRRPVRARALSAAAHRPMSRASTRCGPIAARVTAGRSCSASSAPPTPCMRRWSRGFNTYGIKVGREARGYMEAMMALPAWAEWRAAALKETWIVPEDEADWPTVLTA